jgi:hypothetical protein
MTEKAESDNQFTFAISLSVLNHLGRNLYRSFVTVLGEAISNSWDANAEDVNIYVDREKNSFIIKDDGIGMSRDDFQNKFLKIGYSKRKGGETKSPDKGRPYIGRKGIGKLALLSCSDKITVMSKTADGDYVGGTIDNTGLDDAIENDLTPDQYELDRLDPGVFGSYIEGHKQGTLINFENLKEGINKSPEYLKKLLALYFRFSLIDDSFNIFLDDEKITTSHLKDLGENTQFLWKINECDDPYIQDQLVNLKEKKTISVEGNFNGFIASVEKPRDLKVITTDERVSIDLFANGRLRERNILEYMPSARIVENYLYGQIHYNGLDDEKDRFSSSREGIVTEDPKFVELLQKLKDSVLNKIIEDWDVWRQNLRQPGDPDNERITKRDRTSLDLYNTVSQDYVPPQDSAERERVDSWINGLANDATFNFGSYAECFISENLIRKYIDEENVGLPREAKGYIEEWRRREEQNKRNGNCNIDLRQDDSDISYLDMKGLANLVDKQRGSQSCLPTDAKEYKPIRDALMHTALLTDEAKTKLTSIYNNIRGRVKIILSKKRSKKS